MPLLKVTSSGRKQLATNTVVLQEGYLSSVEQYQGLLGCHIPQIVKVEVDLLGLKYRANYYSCLLSLKVLAKLWTKSILSAETTVKLWVKMRGHV